MMQMCKLIISPGAFFNFNILIFQVVRTGLSMNILPMDNKSPVQECFFKNSAGNLLPALRFLGGLYNFYNFVIILSLM